MLVVFLKLCLGQGPDMGKCHPGASRKVPPHHHHLMVTSTKSAAPEHCPPAPCRDPGLGHMTQLIMTHSRAGKK